MPQLIQVECFLPHKVISRLGEQGRQKHLWVKLKIPRELGDVQKDLCIGQEGGLSFSIKVHSFKTCFTSQIKTQAFACSCYL